MRPRSGVSNPAMRRKRVVLPQPEGPRDRKSTRLNSSHVAISYAVFCLKKKKQERASGINASLPLLSRVRGVFTHRLLTRSPPSPAYNPYPLLDSHGFSTPSSSLLTQDP